MITRTTTVGTLKNYRYDLNRSNNTMAKSMNKVVTRRNFNSYAEDPALATRCFQMRRSYMRTSTQLTLNESLRHKYDVAWSAMDGISQDIDTVAKDTAFTSILTGLNGADASGRNALGQSMAAKARSIVQTMNSRFGENYVFAGADTLNVPFTWSKPAKNPDYLDLQGAAPDPTNPDHAVAFKYKADPALVANGTLPAGTLYTNELDEALTEPVLNESYDPNVPESGGKYMMDIDKADPGDINPDGTHNPTTDDVNKAIQVHVKNEKYNPDYDKKYLKPDGSGTNNKEESAEALYFRGVQVDSMDPEDLAKMEYYTKGEKKYMDVGIGHKEENGEAISSTVFNSALQGIYYLGGYGTSSQKATIGAGESAYEVEKEVPNNIITIMNRMSEILLRCNADDGEWASTEDHEEFMALASKFEDTSSLVKQRWDEMDTESSFLRDNTDFLTDTAESISQQFMALEDAEPAAAISEYMFARYCYDAALKVGNSVLSQSLMDYMNL